MGNDYATSATETKPSPLDVSAAELRGMKVAELRAVLKRYELPASGKKSELLARFETSFNADGTRRTILDNSRYGDTYKPPLSLAGNYDPLAGRAAAPAAEAGLRSSFYDFLEGVEPIRGAGNLAKKLGIDEEAAYRLLDDAEAHGWVKVKADGTYIRIPKGERPGRPDWRPDYEQEFSDAGQNRPPSETSGGVAARGQAGAAPEAGMAAGAGRTARRNRAQLSGTERFDAPGYTGIVAATPAVQGRQGRVYRLYPEGVSIERNQAPVKTLGNALITARLSQHEDGRWEVLFVEKNPEAKGTRLSQALYDAIEADLGQKIRPSGVLTEDGYSRIWMKRDPEAVKYHRYVPSEDIYLSPKQLMADLDHTEMVIRSGTLGQRFAPGAGAIDRLDDPLIKKAVDTYGITRDPKEAGWILPDGRMLDLSGRHNLVRTSERASETLTEERVRGKRWVDHRDLEEILPFPPREQVEPFGLNRSGYDDSRKYDFMQRTHAARVDDQGVFNVVGRPTRMQLLTVLRNRNGRALDIEISDPSNGKSVAHKTFERPKLDAINAFFDKAFGDRAAQSGDLGGEAQANAIARRNELRQILDSLPPEANSGPNFENAFALGNADRLEAELQATLAIQRAFGEAMHRLPEAVRLQIVDRIKFGEYEAAGTMLARTNLLTGLKEAVIQISRSVGKDPRDLVNHETLHALKAIGLFTAREWKAIRDAAAKAGGIAAERQARYRAHFLELAEKRDLHPAMVEHFISDKMAEEWAATDFGEWSLKRAQERESFLGRLWGRVKDFVNDVHAAFTALGKRAIGMDPKPTKGQIYRAIEDGSFARRYREWGLDRVGADNPLSVNRQAGDAYAASLNDDMRAIARDNALAEGKAVETALANLAPCASHYL